MEWYWLSWLRFDDYKIIYSWGESMKEEQAIVLLARYSLSEAEVQEIDQLLKEDFDWYSFFIYALNNKVIGLVFYNLKKYQLMRRMKPIIYYLMKYYYYGNKHRNQVIMKEKELIINAMREKNIRILSLKGGVLLDCVYTDYGSRTCNDLDFFCSLNDVEAIAQVVGGLGYVQGEYNWNTNTVTDFSRIKKLGWKMNMNTIPTYVKKIEGNEYIDFLELDFSYSFDLRKDVSISATVFENSKEYEMSEIDSIIYLCSHLYKEAENDIWIEAKADLNLIKFCDVREAIKRIGERDIESLIARSIELDCWKAVLYCAYYMTILYGDNYLTIINMYKEKGYELIETKFDKLDFSSKSREFFYKRLFNYDNSIDLLDKQFVLKKQFIDEKEEKNAIFRDC